MIFIRVLSCHLPHHLLSDKYEKLFVLYLRNQILFINWLKFKHAPAPITPETLIVREHPPAPPQSFPTKIITIPGKVYEPPPRKVIIEKLAPLPAKPQSIVIERWLHFF